MILTTTHHHSLFAREPAGMGKSKTYRIGSKFIRCVAILLKLLFGSCRSGLIMKQQMNYS
jgi:hypothetical protein